MKETENQLDLSQFTLESLLSDPVEVEEVVDDTVETGKEVVDTPEPDVKTEVKTDEPNDEDDVDLTGFYDTLNKELGIEDFDVAEVEQGIPGLMSYLKTIVVNTVDSEVEDIKSLGDGLLGDMYEFLKNGGKVEDFKKVYFDSVDFKTIAIEGDDNEANQKLVISEYLKEQGFDADEIKEKLESYSETGLLEKESKTAKRKLEVIQDKRKTELVTRQQAARTEQESRVKAYWDDISETINKSDSIGGIPIPKGKKKEFADFLMLKDKDGLTGYQKKIANKEESLKLALASFLNHNYDSIKKEVKTEVTKDLKKTISRFTDTAAKSKSAVEIETDTRKPDFSAFKLPNIHNK